MRTAAVIYTETVINGEEYRKGYEYAQMRRRQQEREKVPETERTGAQEKLFYTAEDLRYCTSNINHCRMRIYERRNNSGHNSTAGADIDSK